MAEAMVGAVDTLEGAPVEAAADVEARAVQRVAAG